MIYEYVGEMLTMKFDGVFSVAIALVLLLLGYGVRRRVSIFDKFCIPAPVIGGLTMALIAWALFEKAGATISFDTSAQAPMMLLFFTTVGIGGSFKLLRYGGRALLVYLALCWFLSIAQNVVGSTMAWGLGIHPLLGVMTGAVPLIGGHGAAAAFGETAETLGVVGAKAVAIAAATFGLISGSLMGGPVARWLISKNNVTAVADGQSKAEIDELKSQETAEGSSFFTSRETFNMLALMFVCMALGMWLAKWIVASTGFVVPHYVGAMFIAIIFRNLNDKLHIVKLNQRCIDILSDVSLGIFLSLAIMSMKIWELYNLALPMVIILAVQLVFIFCVTAFLLFPALGRNYDAAVMCSGYIGHGLGATPNAVANMGAVCEHYGAVSYKAFLIVPLCGAVLVDMVHLPNIAWFINFLK